MSSKLMKERDYFLHNAISLKNQQQLEQDLVAKIKGKSERKEPRKQRISPGKKFNVNIMDAIPFA